MSQRKPSVNHERAWGFPPPFLSHLLPPTVTKSNNRKTKHSLGGMWEICGVAVRLGKICKQRHIAVAFLFELHMQRPHPQLQASWGGWDHLIFPRLKRGESKSHLPSRKLPMYPHRCAFCSLRTPIPDDIWYRRKWIAIKLILIQWFGWTDSQSKREVGLRNWDVLLVGKKRCHYYWTKNQLSCT